MFTRSLRIIERTLKAFNSPIFYSFRLSAALLLKSFNSIQKSMWIYVLIKRLAIFDQAFQIYLNYFFLYIYFLYALQLQHCEIARSLASICFIYLSISFCLFVFIVSNLTLISHNIIGNIMLLYEYEFETVDKYREWQSKSRSLEEINHQNRSKIKERRKKSHFIVNSIILLARVSVPLLLTDTLCPMS